MTLRIRHEPFVCRDCRALLNGMSEALPGKDMAATECYTLCGYCGAVYRFACSVADILIGLGADTAPEYVSAAQVPDKVRPYALRAKRGQVNPPSGAMPWRPN